MKQLLAMKNKRFKNSATILPLLLLPVLCWSQSGGEAVDSGLLGRLFGDTLLVVGVLVILFAFLALFRLSSMLMELQKIRLLHEKGIEVPVKVELVKTTVPWWKRLYKKATASVPLEREEDILFDHAYDGIRELDNRLPPWWVAVFYISIAFAAVYLVYYHVSGVGLSSQEEYALEMEQAEKAVKAYLASQPDQVDETNVAMLENEQEIALGQTIYQTNCAVCHGQSGEGGVGPNLTDIFWINGGSLQDVFKIIKYGVPEKGMISWKAQLRASDMQKVASFIMTLQGTNPANAKEPQGDPYAPGADQQTENPAEIGMADGSAQ